MPKPTGELALFQSIWATRKHVCQVSGEPLGDFNICYFSHVLSKKAYPKFRLYDKNIVLKTPDLHRKWETTPFSDLQKEQRWLWVIDLHDELKREYYANNSGL